MIGIYEGPEIIAIMSYSQYDRVGGVFLRFRVQALGFFGQQPFGGKEYGRSFILGRLKLQNMLVGCGFWFRL